MKKQIILTFIPLLFHCIFSTANISALEQVLQFQDTDEFALDNGNVEDQVEFSVSSHKENVRFFPQGKCHPYERDRCKPKGAF